jgi:hypothetical protein
MNDKVFCIKCEYYMSYGSEIASTHHQECDHPHNIKMTDYIHPLDYSYRMTIKERNKHGCCKDFKRKTTFATQLLVMFFNFLRGRKKIEVSPEDD